MARSHRRGRPVRPRPPGRGREESPPRKADLDGALDKAVVRAGIQKIIPQIQTCYESALEKTPDLNGRLLVKFKIRTQDGKGRGGGGGDPAGVGQPPCWTRQQTGQGILEALAAAEFPAPEDGGEVTVSYPFVLMANPVEGGPSHQAH